MGLKKNKVMPKFQILKIVRINLYFFPLSEPKLDGFSFRLQELSGALFRNSKRKPGVHKRRGGESI